MYDTCKYFTFKYKGTWSDLLPIDLKWEWSRLRCCVSSPAYLDLPVVLQCVATFPLVRRWRGILWMQAWNKTSLESWVSANKTCYWSYGTMKKITRSTYSIHMGQKCPDTICSLIQESQEFWVTLVYHSTMSRNIIFSIFVFIM